MIGVFIMDKNMLDRLVTSEKRVEEIDALLSEPNITSDLKRFNIVVIKTENSYLIKRIIGLPGEKIKYEIKD